MIKSSQVPNQEHNQVIDQVISSIDQVSSSWYAGGEIILGLGGIGFYLYYSQKKFAKAPAEAVAVKNDDIFQLI